MTEEERRVYRAAERLEKDPAFIHAVQYLKDYAMNAFATSKMADDDARKEARFSLAAAEGLEQLIANWAGESRRSS